MYIREYMHTYPIIVDSDTLISEATKIMLDSKIRRLPVVDHGNLVGLITRGKIREFTSHQVTSLTKWELNCLLDKAKVKEIMETNLFTVTPDTLFEHAIVQAQEYGFGTILVVDSANSQKLLGIVTTTDLYKIIAQIMGFGQKGARLLLIDPCGNNDCEQAVRILIEEDVRIRSFFHISRSGRKTEDVMIHTGLDDAQDVSRLLTERGYSVEIREAAVQSPPYD